MGAMREMSSKVVCILAVAAFFAAAAARPANAAMQSQNAVAGAAQQSNQSSDLTITRNIRRALVKDKSLSVEAHNVTIITKDGKVTLKGRVESAAEKQTVESAANNVAGVGNVDDQLTTSNQ
jgi:hyperosmotically inducible periplasmic protein